MSAYCYHKHREAERNRHPFSEYLFTDEHGRLIHPDTFTKHLRKFYDRHGFSKEYHLHTLRHLYVTTLLHGGVDKQTVADLAGHGDTSFLERTYCHPQMERKLEAARVISGIIPNSVEDKSA
jgi:site-specific recombinase XerD